MSKNPEIIIIGAGISGASMAYFLASKGVKDRNNEEKIMNIHLDEDNLLYR